MIRETQNKLDWQSKVVLLLVLPCVFADALLQSHWWIVQVPVVAWTALGISSLFGLTVWRLRAATPGAATTGAAITASLMYSSTQYPYQYSWLHGGLFPLLTVFLLTFAATKIGKAKKERLGTGENRRGRNAAQVAANLGVAALIAQPVVAMTSSLASRSGGQWLAYIAALAALAEAASDTVSSEIGQVLGGKPRMLTTLHHVEPGTDGGVTLAGTAAGILAATLVAMVGIWVMSGSQRIFGSWILIGIVSGGGTFGLLFDSLLGATLERKGWLNNDAVNFLSTLAAALIALVGITYLGPLVVL